MNDCDNTVSSRAHHTLIHTNNTLEFKWQTWMLSKTEAFRFLFKFLFALWDINTQNNFRGFLPHDIIFSKYISGKGIFNHTQDKEVYHFALQDKFIFHGRVYPSNFQFFQEKQDLFIQHFTHKITDNGYYTIFEDIVIYDNVLISFD
jgi:hypothetical protein